MTGKRKIAIVTSTRADWGLLSPVADALRAYDNVSIHIIATNMHLDPTRGMTVNEITADGFDVDCKVVMTPESDSPADTVRAAARCMSGMADALDSISPDILLILGDRYEILAAATAATLLRIPIAHISGGELTEGAFDDNIRHALSKLSSLHFATTENHRRRLIAMGEQPAAVINAGAIGVANILSIPLMTRNELEESLGFEFRSPALLVTFHPATNDPTDPATRFSALIEALDRFTEACIIITYPNNDPHAAELIRMIERYASVDPWRIHAIPSLGRKRYLSALRHVDAVVGNSSSGIVEVPSAGIPTVDIGCRQRGRTSAGSVIHCGDSATEIATAIHRALSAEMKEISRKTTNPYYRPDTVRIIADTLASVPVDNLLPKKFYDIIPLT